MCEGARVGARTEGVFGVVHPSMAPRAQRALVSVRERSSSARPREKTPRAVAFSSATTGSAAASTGGEQEQLAAVARPAPDFTRADLEASLWRAALLVRCHDRNRGLRLSRDEAQRKLLDLRCYELLLAYVRAAE